MPEVDEGHVFRCVPVTVLLQHVHHPCCAATVLKSYIMSIIVIACLFCWCNFCSKQEITDEWS
jgi:hypothetical protein